ncbi:MAG TPA: peptidoglycan editing factor PgeF [Desulfomonilia bacterium]
MNYSNISYNMNGIFCTKDYTGGIDGSAESVKNKLAIGLGSNRVFTLNQVHGDAIVSTSEIISSGIPEADGIISNNPEDALVIRTADCVPVLFTSEEGIFAAVHAGWKGLAKGIIGKCISKMKEMGAHNLSAAIGPAVGPCCFRVGNDVATLLPSKFQRNENGIIYADLWETAKAQAQSGGIEGYKIAVLKICTCCNPELFFSYRRQSGTDERQLSIIGENTGLKLLPGFKVL